MKKKLSLFLALCLMSVLALSACGGGTSGTSTPSAGTGTTASTPVADSEPVKVALLLAGNLGDLSILDSAKAGMDAVAAKYSNVQLKVIEMGADPSAYETNFLDASEEYDIIIGSGWQTQEPIEKIAPQFPEKNYILFDAAVDNTDGEFNNVYSITYKQNEASFLAGYMAGKMTETGIIGFLGGAYGPVINDFMIGYIEGAQYANPDTKVLVGYVDSFTDSAKGKEMALSQYNQGKADIVLSAAGGAGMGTLDAARESGNLAIGADSDQAMLFIDSDPEKAEHIPTSVMKRVDNSLIRAFDLYFEGTLSWGETESLGLNEDGVGLAENEVFERLVPAELREELVGIRQEIIDGKIAVTSAFGKDNDEIAVIVNSAKP